MVRLPHDIFKLVLSFKDPRYERVRNGDPFGATPTRVWYTYKEHKKAEDPYKNVNMYDTPSAYYWGTSAIRRFEKPSMGLWCTLCDVRIKVFGKFHVAHDDYSRRQFKVGRAVCELEDRLDPSDEDADGDVFRCSPKVAEMALQCEACGP